MSKTEETTHSFEVDDVEKYGSIEKALIMKEIKGMSIYKIRNRKDGWVYYSRNALEKKFPYMKAGSIKRWMVKLEKDEFLNVKIKNKFKYDKTKSYFPTEYLSLAKEKEKEKGSAQNGLIVGQNDQPIGQNDQPIGQNDQTIPSLTSSLTSSQSEKERFQEKRSSSLEEELTYEEPDEDTYKTKQKIYKQKGLNYKPPERSKAQKAVWDTELLARYLKDKAMEIHRVKVFIDKTKSSTSWTSLKRAIRLFGLDEAKKMIDFYLASEKYDKFGADPKTIFSNHSINLFYQRPKQNNKSLYLKTDKIYY